MMRGVAMIRFVGRHSCAVVFWSVPLLFATVLFGDEPSAIEQPPKAGQESNVAAAEPNKESKDQQAKGEKTIGEEVRSFQPVETETDPDPIPGLRVPVDMQSDNVVRQIRDGENTLLSMLMAAYEE